MTKIYYLIRSQLDGRYLVARPPGENTEGDRGKSGYLLLFKEDFDALSYLNTHAGDVRDRFAVESLSQTQLKTLMQRWGFQGVGLVKDPLEPQIQFLTYHSMFYP